MNIGGVEILVVFLIVLVVFGPKRLPEVARFLSKAAREVRSALDEIRRELDSDDHLEG